MRSAVFPIFLIVLVDMASMMMIVPLLPFYAERFGASAFTIGLLASSFAICQLFSAPWLGGLSDRIGRKPVLIVSQAGTLAGFLLMAFANNLWMLFLARIIDGITAGNLPLAQACIVDVTEPHERAKAFGLIGVAFGIGLILGPAVSGWLAGYDWTYPMYGAALLSALSIAVTARWLPVVAPTAKAETAPVSFLDYFRRPRLGPLLAQFFLFVFILAFFAQNLAIFAQGRFRLSDGKAFGPTEVGYLFAYCGVLGVFVQGWLIGKLVPRFGEKRLVTVAFLIDVLGYLCLGLASGIPGLILGCTLFSFGNATLRPVLTSLITQRAARDEQGTVLGLTISLQSVGQVVGPPLGGALLDRSLFTVWAFVLSGLCFFGFGRRVLAPEND